jgi:cell division septal protein FtsQ
MDLQSALATRRSLYSSHATNFILILLLLLLALLLLLLGVVAAALLLLSPIFSEWMCLFDGFDCS